MAGRWLSLGFLALVCGANLVAACEFRLQQTAADSLWGVCCQFGLQAAQKSHRRGHFLLATFLAARPLLQRSACERDAHSQLTHCCRLALVQWERNAVAADRQQAMTRNQRTSVAGQKLSTLLMVALLSSLAALSSP